MLGASRAGVAVWATRRAFTTTVPVQSSFKVKNKNTKEKKKEGEEIVSKSFMEKEFVPEMKLINKRYTQKVSRSNVSKLKKHLEEDALTHKKFERLCTEENNAKQEELKRVTDAKLAAISAIPDDLRQSALEIDYTPYPDILLKQFPDTYPPRPGDNAEKWWADKINAQLEIKVDS